MKQNLILHLVFSILNYYKGLINDDFGFISTVINTVFPQIRPAGVIFLQGIQLRVLLECGHYSRTGINIRTNLDLDINPCNPDQNRDLCLKKQQLA